MAIFEGQKPENVLRIFEDLCSIHHPSKEEKGISDYIVHFAMTRNLNYYQDELNNVIIKKDASPGYEDKDTIILQAHMDMVYVTEDGYSEQRGVIPYIEDDFIKAKGTSLGADDGIGVAYMLAILDSDEYPHPKLECVFTTGEEIGLLGASGLDLSRLSGKKLINLDSEEENNLVIGCAGGCVGNISYDYKRSGVSGLLVEISVEGLTGGHSGVEIHKGRGSANVLLGRLLYELNKEIKYGLVSIDGGQKDNAIATSAKAQIVIRKLKLKSLESFIEKINNIYQKEFNMTDPKLEIKLNVHGKYKGKKMHAKEMPRLFVLMNNTFAGPIKMRQEDLTLVETSMNFGTIKVSEGSANIIYSLRSNAESGLKWQKDRLEMLVNFVKANILFEGEYPAWESNGVNDFAKFANEKYYEMYGKHLYYVTEHAGLECALFYSKNPEIQAISIGPDLINVHTTKEAASIKSINKSWNFLLEILKG